MNFTRSLRACLACPAEEVRLDSGGIDSVPDQLRAALHKHRLRVIDIFKQVSVRADDNDDGNACCSSSRSSSRGGSSGSRGTDVGSASTPLAVHAR